MSASQGKQTLFRSLTDDMNRRVALVCIISGLVVMWCVLDSWNHEMSAELFQMNQQAGLTADKSGMLTMPEPFKYTLTLIFLQFAFLGVVFCSIFAFKVVSAGECLGQSLEHLWPTTSDGRWPALVGTHIFGSLLLQSLIMPSQMMSLSLFAATRAVEVPTAACVRARLFGLRSDGPSLRTIMLMFAAAWLLCFSYTQIAECMCVWTGFGVALSGVALYFVYGLLLTIPATNVVLQESILVQLQVNPILMQGVQNLCAAVVFVPMLIAAHLLGYEDVNRAFAMIMGQREVYMTVLWLCVQLAIISAVTVGMILMVDSFWAVAARSLRVVFWWVRHLPVFYFTSDTLLTVGHPHASIWSFVMVCGIVLGFTALVTDKREGEEALEGKSLVVSSERNSESKSSGISKYV